MVALMKNPATGRYYTADQKMRVEGALDDLRRAVWRLGGNDELDELISDKGHAVSLARKIVKKWHFTSYSAFADAADRCGVAL